MKAESIRQDSLAGGEGFQGKSGHEMEAEARGNRGKLYSVWNRCLFGVYGLTKILL